MRLQSLILSLNLLNINFLDNIMIICDSCKTSNSAYDVDLKLLRRRDADHYSKFDLCANCHEKLINLLNKALVASGLPVLHKFGQGV